MRRIEEEVKVLFEEFSALIRYVILHNLHKTDTIDVEDVEQEVKIKIWKYIKKGKKVRNLPSYIKKVAYTVTIDELRKMRKQVPDKKPDNLENLYISWKPEKNSNSPETALEEKELKSKLEELVESLSQNRKQVLRLYMKGMTVEEICLFFSWDKTKVRHLLYRGIDEIKQKYKDE